MAKTGLLYTGSKVPFEQQRTSCRSWGTGLGRGQIVPFRVLSQLNVSSGERSLKTKGEK